MLRERSIGWRGTWNDGWREISRAANWGQITMRTIIIKLPPTADLSFEIAEMRGWLNSHSCAPSSFKYDLEQDSTIIHVQFTKEEEAEVFKRHFNRKR